MPCGRKQKRGLRAGDFQSQQPETNQKLMLKTANHLPKESHIIHNIITHQLIHTQNPQLFGSVSTACLSQ